MFFDSLNQLIVCIINSSIDYQLLLQTDINNELFQSFLEIIVTDFQSFWTLLVTSTSTSTCDTTATSTSSSVIRIILAAILAKSQLNILNNSFQLIINNNNNNNNLQQLLLILQIIQLIANESEQTHAIEHTSDTRERQTQNYCMFESLIFINYLLIQLKTQLKIIAINGSEHTENTHTAIFQQIIQLNYRIINNIIINNNNNNNSIIQLALKFRVLFSIIKLNIQFTYKFSNEMLEFQLLNELNSKLFEIITNIQSQNSAVNTNTPTDTPTDTQTDTQTANERELSDLLIVLFANYSVWKEVLSENQVTSDKLTDKPTD